MRKTILAILAIAAALAAQTDAKALRNINGWNDTTSLPTFKTTNTVYTTDAFGITCGEPIRVVMMANDTDAAGFKSDSLKFAWGYQTGCRVINGSGTLDTAWYGRVTIDTVNVDSFGIAAVSKVSQQGVSTMVTTSQGDTTSVTGYVVQSRYIIPLYDEFIRFWATGLTGNNKSSDIKNKIVVRNRLGQRTF